MSRYRRRHILPWRRCLDHHSISRVKRLICLEFGSSNTPACFWCTFNDAVCTMGEMGYPSFESRYSIDDLEIVQSAVCGHAYVGLLYPISHGLPPK